MTEINLFPLRNVKYQMTQLILLRLSVEYATREVSRPSFTVKTPLLSRATKQVSIGNIVFY